MSLPKHTSSPPLSSSPSGHSIRRPADSNPPSRPQSISRPPTAQPAHPLTEEYHSYERATHDPSMIPEDGGREEATGISRPPFQPFFTLIEDSSSSEYYHPTVHYIFSDDDTDIVTEAALRSLETEQDSFPGGGKGKSQSTRESRPSHAGVGEDAAYDVEDDLESPKKEPLLPSPIPGVRDNYIILDMDMTPPTDASNPPPDRLPEGGIPGSPGAQQPQPATDRFKVTSAHSLTPAWQVLNTELVPAPTFENNTSDEQSVNGGLMLKIRGTSGLPINMPGKDRDKERSGQRLEDMMDQFSKRLVELRQVIEAGGPFQHSEERSEQHAPTGAPYLDSATQHDATHEEQGQGETEDQSGSYVGGLSHPR
ncbi:hypothetical protein BDV59DRAFT_178812 [Aspergillus ambiguus]|uniref:uncharacterized protein n=1 Tax=Aspergillus ambiguus TaxID=176160 RepID=UPI003CCE0A52